MEREIGGAERMLEPGVGRTGKNVFRKAQLFNVAQPLERGVIDYATDHAIELQIAMNLVA